MVFSRYELDCRDFVFNKVRGICVKSGATVYGSFATANFHLNVDKWESLSDVDLIANIDNESVLGNNIHLEIESETGLNIRTSIRKSNKHVADLPADISYYLALVDTSTNLLLAKEADDEYFSYLVAKYLLRTLYKDLYFEKSLPVILDSAVRRKTSKLFQSLALCKLRGEKYSCNEFVHMSELTAESDCRIIDGLRLLCSMQTDNDISNQWCIFLEITSKHGLNELRQDLFRKMEMVINNPNNSFNPDCQTRRLLSLTLGLSAGYAWR